MFDDDYDDNNEDDGVDDDGKGDDYYDDVASAGWYWLTGGLSFQRAR